MQKCDWCLGNKLYEKYHDEEWGVEVHEDKTLFEFLVLESAQAGLSWLTILKKRENYRIAYNHFDVQLVSKYNGNSINKLMNNSGIIRNKLKITASINNAVQFIKVQNEFGNFDRYLWQFVDNRQINNHITSIKDIPTRSELSDEISKDMKKRGFKFIGTTIIYAYLEAVGVINDHIKGCPSLNNKLNNK